MKDKTSTPPKSPYVNYKNYLMLDQLLSAQNPQSLQHGVLAHDEYLFITVHQIHELWFKQVLFEIDSIREQFLENTVDDRKLSDVCAKLERVNMIMGSLIPLLKILETMTPMEFMEFRDYLSTASGFQSLQFRLIESKLGLTMNSRRNYSNKSIEEYLEPTERKQFLETVQQPSIFNLVEKWLERTPFIESTNYKFMEHYKSGIIERIRFDQKDSILPENDQDLLSQNPKIAAIFDAGLYTQLIQEGKKRLSWRATLAALFIHLYREEPILTYPFKTLRLLVDLDESIHSWRSAHVQLVMRIIGPSVGTGGSSGASYLRQTLDQHRVFTDFTDLAALLVPRRHLPNIPKNIKESLGYRYSPET